MSDSHIQDCAPVVLPLCCHWLLCKWFLKATVWHSIAQPCMYELKCGGLLMVCGWSVDCQNLPPRFNFFQLPRGLPQESFPDRWSVRSQTIAGDHQTKQCSLWMTQCRLHWNKCAFSVWITTKNYNKQLVWHNFWKQPTGEVLHKKLCTLMQLFLYCSLSSYGFQLPTASPNTLK
jgi:hypothetical protein